MDTNRWLAAKRTSIVNKYADQASAVYAPMQRDGRFPDSRPEGRAIETEHFVPSTAMGLQALQNYFPKAALDINVQVRMSAATMLLIASPRGSRDGLVMPLFVSVRFERDNRVLRAPLASNR